MKDVETELRELEEKLLQPAFRRDSEAVSDLLADEFREFGSSGRVFNKQQIIAALGQELPAQLSLTDFQADVLAPGVVFVTYRGMQGSVVKSLRCSIWIFRNGRWRMVFHQGTKLPSGD